MKRHRDPAGKVIWTINSAPVSQRDDGERMSGLTDENVAAMTKALQYVQRI